MGNRFIPDQRLRTVVQLGVPLALLAFYWNVLGVLQRFSSVCLLAQSEQVCELSGAEYSRVALTLAYAVVVFFAVRLLTLALVDSFVLPPETRDGLQRTAMQAGLPLLVLLLHWDVFGAGWACLSQPPEITCAVGRSDWFQVALSVVLALGLYFVASRQPLVLQSGIPLLVLVFFWDVFSTLWHFGRVCLSQPAELPCDVGGSDLFQTALTVAFALVVYSAMRLLTTVLVAQFVLPVETWAERRKVIERLQAYTSADPGPALFVRDGQLIEHHGEQQERKGKPGVILVDSSSEVVLQTDTEFKGVRGPGVVFTAGGEQVIALDMRKQQRTAEKVKAITRDGLEVTANITVTFALDSGEASPFRDWRDPDRPPYRYNPVSAFHVVYGRAVDAKYRDVPWSELPPLVATDVWRDLLIERDLESLFSKSEVGLPPLKELQDELTARLKPPSDSGQTITTFSRTEAPFDRKDVRREYQVLAARGIRVVSVFISGFDIDKTLKEQRIRNWQENWQQRARERAARADPVIAAERVRGKVEGQIEILDRVTRNLRRSLGLDIKPPIKVVLQSLLHATRELARDAAIYGETLSTDQNTLDNLEIWAAGLHDDGTPGASGAGGL